MANSNNNSSALNAKTVAALKANNIKPSEWKMLTEQEQQERVPELFAAAPTGVMSVSVNASENTSGNRKYSIEGDQVYIYLSVHAEGEYLYDLRVELTSVFNCQVWDHKVNGVNVYKDDPIRLALIEAIREHGADDVFPLLDIGFERLEVKRVESLEDKASKFALKSLKSKKPSVPAEGVVRLNPEHAEDFTVQDFLDIGWTLEGIVAKGHGEWEIKPAYMAKKPPQPEVKTPPQPEVETESTQSVSPRLFKFS